MDLNQAIIAYLMSIYPYMTDKSGLKISVESRLGRNLEDPEFKMALTHLQSIQLIGKRSDAFPGDQTEYFFFVKRVL